MNKPKKQSFEKGAVVLIIATAISKIIGALFKIPLNNLIGDLGFGYYSSAYDLFLPIYGISMTGLPIVVSQMVSSRVAETKFRDAKTVFNISKTAFSAAGLLITFLMILLINPFLKLTDMTGESLYSLLSIAPAIFFCFLISAYRGYYEGLNNMYPTAVSNVIEAVCKLVFGYTFAYITMKTSKNVAYAAAAAIWGVTIGMILGTLAVMLIGKVKGCGIQKSQCDNSLKTENKRSLLKIIFVLSVPIVLSSLITNISSLIDVVTIKWQLGRLMAEHGDFIKTIYSESINSYNREANTVLSDSTIPTFLYGVRSKTYTIYNLIPTIAAVLGVSALPTLVKVWCAKREDKREIKKCINSVLRFTSLLVFPAGIGMIAIAPQIMELLYDSFASVQIGAPLLRIYGAAALFAGMCVPLMNMLQAVEKHYAALYNMIVGLVVKIILNIVLASVPRINVNSAAIGTLCCYAVIFILNFHTLVKHTGVMPDITANILKPFAAALVCGGSAYLFVCSLGVSSVATILAIMFAAIVYAVMVLLLKVVTFEELLSHLRIKNRKFSQKM